MAEETETLGIKFLGNEGACFQSRARVVKMVAKRETAISGFLLKVRF